MKTDKKRAVTILLHNEDGKILAVSRKNDVTDFGIPGGKVDDGETDEIAIIREVKEETGLSISNLKPYFIDEERDEFICTTFIGNYKGDIITSEKGAVAWVDWAELKAGSFGEYNAKLEDFFNNNHKFIENSIIKNPVTQEKFTVLKTVHGNSYLESGYFVNASYSHIGYAFVKKSAIDAIRMDVISNDFTEDALKIDQFKYYFKYYAISSHFDVNHYYGKDDTLLYSYHLQMAVNVGYQFKPEIPEDDWTTVEAGLWSHDLIEDARRTYNDVKKELGEKVADISFALANTDGKDRSERAGDRYYEKIRNTKYATFCKLCDRIANVKYSLQTKSSMADKYYKEQANFKKQLYVPGQYEAMWNLLDKMLGLI